MCMYDLGIEFFLPHELFFCVHVTHVLTFIQDLLIRLTLSFTSPNLIYFFDTKFSPRGENRWHHLQNATLSPKSFGGIIFCRRHKIQYLATKYNGITTTISHLFWQQWQWNHCHLHPSSSSQQEDSCHRPCSYCSSW